MPVKRNRRLPWLFGLLTALILLAGGTAVGLAARLVVAPQAGETVEVDTASLPTAMGQSVDEVVFYPWNLYDEEHFETIISEELKAERMPWYVYNLEGVPITMGFSGMSASLEKGRVRNYSGYWTDCPVNTRDGQTALLDVAFGQDYQDFGMTWVARSTGELPTRAQRDAALAVVQEDVCQFLTQPAEQSPIGSLLSSVWTYLATSPFLDSGGVWYETLGATALDGVLGPLEQVRQRLYDQEPDPNLSVQQRLEQICTVAQEEANCYVQLVTTQRQVVVVFTCSQPEYDSWNIVGLYYDVGLEQYSGIAINSRAGYGYGY